MIPKLRKVEYSAPETHSGKANADRDPNGALLPGQGMAQGEKDSEENTPNDGREFGIPAHKRIYDHVDHLPVGWGNLFIKIHERARMLLGRLKGRRGPNSYKDSRKEQKKTGKRKGVLVDKKAA